MNITITNELTLYSITGEIMSERYTKLFTLPARLYAEGSPVIIEAGALSKDNDTGRVFAQLRFRNMHSCYL